MGQAYNIVFVVFFGPIVVRAYAASIKALAAEVVKTLATSMRPFVRERKVDAACVV